MTRAISMDKNTEKNIRDWLSGNYDESSKKWIKEKESEGSESELIDAFYKRLEFGTGGMRGKMGVGLNRMNIYTIRAITAGLANYLSKQPKKGTRHSVLIGYDSRNHSREFAEETARVLAANNIEVFIYRDIRPVALVSFGVLYKECSAGVMITASHNPPEYNGYKVYWSSGVQVLPPHDTGITAEYDKIEDLSSIKRVDFSHPLIHEVGDEIDKAYIDTISLLALHPGQNHSQGRGLHIVYTPLHGTGITLVPQALQAWGFSHLSLVESQVKPDGNFPTVKVPNPEEPATLKEGIKKLKEVEGDILIATDPDADRIAIVQMIDGVPYLFNGNEMACILLNHILSSLKESKEMPPKPTCIKTIVTTELFKKIADYYQVFSLEVLTGFKYIGEKIFQWEEEKRANVTSHHYIFGGEESYGYLYGTHARDKDAIIISNLASECALALKLQGKTLLDMLYELYHKHGVYREKLKSLTFEGKEGMEKIEKIMQNLRSNPPKEFNGCAVVTMEDYLTHQHISLESGHKDVITLPKSDVIRFFLSDQTKIVIRPSGTEPKLKIYIACLERHSFADKQAIEKAIKMCDEKLESYLQSIIKPLQESGS